MRLAFILVLFVFGLAQQGAGQSSELTSPDGRYTVEIIDRQLPHADSWMGDSTLVLSSSGPVILRIPTTGYLIDALWSSDGRYVAVNNRRGNSGDYVWVFSLTDGVVLKKPDDETISFPLGKIMKMYSDCNENSFDADLMIAKAWRSANELEVEERWRFYNTALIVRRAAYKVSGHTMALAEEHIARHPFDWQPPEE
jgi:hypothetical protein